MYRDNGKVVLSSLVTEVHVSDEDRDFISSTNILSAKARPGRAETVGVDEDNDNSQEPVELPAIP